MWLPAAAPEPQHKDEQRSVIMRLEELIIYKDFSQGELLHHMVYLMEHYREKKDRALEVRTKKRSSESRISASYGVSDGTLPGEKGQGSFL